MDLAPHPHTQPCRKLHCFQLVCSLEEDSGWLQSSLVAAGRGSGRSPDTRGRPEGALNCPWVLEAASQVPAPPTLGAGLWSSSGGRHLREDLRLFLKPVFPMKLGVRVSVRRALGTPTEGVSLRFLRRTGAASAVCRVLPPFSGFCTSWKRVPLPRWFHLFQKRWV